MQRLSYTPLAIIRGVLSGATMISSTLFWCTFLLFFALIKLFTPWASLRRVIARLLVAIAQNWIAVNAFVLKHISGIALEAQVEAALDARSSYLVIANHQSWSDILVLQVLMNRRIPFLRFFLKRELIWVPVLGLAWWALDFPFMRRYSKAFLKKNPALAGKDLESTRKACEKFRQQPVSVMNFVEGTRFSPRKHQRQHSPFGNLLKPKAGGTGYVLTILGEQIAKAVDVTLYYPGGATGFWPFVCGLSPRVEVVVHGVDLPADIRCDYVNDKACRVSVQRWINGIWEHKDELLDKMRRNGDSEAD